MNRRCALAETPPSCRCVVAIAAAAVLSAVPAVWAVEVQVGQIYTGGTRLEVAGLGVAFTVPQGWRGALPAGSEVFLLQPQSDPNVYILAMGEQATRAELAAMMAEQIPLGDGLTLSPSGGVTERGKALAARYQVFGGASQLSAYGEALAASHGVGVAYVLIAAPASLAAHEPALRALTDGTALDSPTGGQAGGGGGQTATGTTSGSDDSWAGYLKGKYIVRYYTATGYTDEQHLWLCSNGTFYRQGASGGFGGGASGAFQADSSGRWSATGRGASGRLVLQYGDGSTAQHELWWDYEKNQLNVDGKRWLHDKNTYCD